MYLGSSRPFDAARLSESGWIAVSGVKEVRQEDDKACGAAALEMVLSRFQEPCSQADIIRNCRLDPVDGILAGALREFARAHGFRARLIRGRREDIEYELRRGRPPIVGLVKPYADRAALHYEVVVAIHMEREEIVTIDPGRGYTINSWEGFQQEWQPSDRLLLAIGPFPRGAE